MRLKHLTLIASLGPALLLCTSAQAASIVTKQVDLGTLSLPTTASYSTVFKPDAVAATDTFYEDYSFAVPAASFASLSFSLTVSDLLNINNLQARLYTGDLGTATVGAVLSPEQLLQRWTAPLASGGTGTVSVIDQINLSAGSYVLELRGQVTGTTGGAYAGLLNVSAVPEPQTSAMLAAGLLALVWMSRRRG